MSNVSEHPNAALRKEIEILKIKIKTLEEDLRLQAQSILVVIEKQEALRVIMIRSIEALAKVEKERLTSKDPV